MTDLYIRREQPSKRPIVVALIIIALIVVAVVTYNLWGRRTPNPSEPPVSTAADTSLPAPSQPETDDAGPDAPAASPAPTAAGSTSGPIATSGTLAEVEQLRQAGNLEEARAKVLGILETVSDPQVRSAAETRAGQINIELALTPRQMAEKIDYAVEPGDTLQALATRFATTIELLQKSNNISGPMIRIGQRLRILQGAFSIAVDKSDNTLVVFLNDRFFKRYPVGTGEFNKTPVGSFKITDRISQPTWWRDGKAVAYGDPENVLGTHWLSLDVPGYGIHGTWEPETIGRQSSAGCVRLTNENVEELYTLIPIGTPVVITD